MARCAAPTASQGAAADEPRSAQSQIDAQGPRGSRLIGRALAGRNHERDRTRRLEADGMAVVRSCLRRLAVRARFWKRRRGSRDVSSVRDLWGAVVGGVVTANRVLGRTTVVGRCWSGTRMASTMARDHTNGASHGGGCCRVVVWHARRASIRTMAVFRQFARMEPIWLWSGVGIYLTGVLVAWLLAIGPVPSKFAIRSSAHAG